uniref:Uncharacterized protein n=1 Tax=Timspurckia oligopyrenoides TaxID=708627 RepID=A0A7S0ZCG6_9RHOD
MREQIVRVKRQIRRARAMWRLHRKDWNAFHAPYQPPKEFEYLYKEAAWFPKNETPWRERIPTLEELKSTFKLYAATWYNFHKKSAPRHPLVQELFESMAQEEREKVEKLAKEAEEFRELGLQNLKDIRDEFMESKKRLDGIEEMITKDNAKYVLKNRIEILQEGIKEFRLGYARGVKLQESRMEEDMKMMQEYRDEIQESARKQYEQFMEERKAASEQKDSKEDGKSDDDFIGHALKHAKSFVTGKKLDERTPSASALFEEAREKAKTLFVGKDKKIPSAGEALDEAMFRARKIAAQAMNEAPPSEPQRKSDAQVRMPTAEEALEEAMRRAKAVATDAFKKPESEQALSELEKTGNVFGQDLEVPSGGQILDHSIEKGRELLSKAGEAIQTAYKEMEAEKNQKKTYSYYTFKQPKTLTDSKTDNQPQENVAQSNTQETQRDSVEKK